MPKNPIPNNRHVDGSGIGAALLSIHVEICEIPLLSKSLSCPITQLPIFPITSITHLTILLILIDKYGDDNNRPDSHLLPEGRNIQ